MHISHFSKAYFAFGVFMLAPALMAQSPDTTATAELYGSIRLHANYASVDNAADTEDNNFLGLTDAYSRLGAKASLDNNAVTLTAKYELNIDSANLDIGDPSFFDDEDSRLYSLTATTDYGTLTVGKDWLPYYNAVGYPVDYFSSVYAGYTTYAYFREKQIAYTTPSLNNFTGTIARIERTADGPLGWHYALSYSDNGLTLALGQENMDGSEGDTQGASVSYSKGAWYLASKYENSDDYGDIVNGFAQYTHNKFTYKFGGGFGDQFSGDTYHIGLDYQMSNTFKLFTEFYSEEKNYAILGPDAKSASDYFGAGGFGAKQGGKALLAGFRVDFSTAK